MTTRIRDIKEGLERKYNDTAVPVEKVMEDYMGVSGNTFKKNKDRYLKTLHFRVFQMGNSKSPYLVSTSELAKYIAKQEDLGI